MIALLTISVVIITTGLVAWLGLFRVQGQLPELESKGNLLEVSRRFGVNHEHASWIIREQDRLGCRSTDIRLQNLARALRRLEHNH